MHKKELKGVQRKYFEAKSVKDKVHEEGNKLKEELYNKYRQGRFMDLEIDMNSSKIDIRTEFIEEIYKQGDLNIVAKYLDSINPKVKNEILLAEYRKGNISFVYKNFKAIDDGDLKNTILKVILNEENYEFLYENYNYISNLDIKEKIIKYAYKEGNVDFLNKHLEDMPKSLKLEAAIRFKDLKLSKEELDELLRR